jgi:hypothetical protein
VRRDFRHSERLEANDRFFAILDRLANPVVPKNDVCESRMAEESLPLATSRSSSDADEHWRMIGDAKHRPAGIALAQSVRAVLVLSRAQKVQVRYVVLDDRTVNFTARDWKWRFLKIVKTNFIVNPCGKMTN